MHCSSKHYLHFTFSSPYHYPWMYFGVALCISQYVCIYQGWALTAGPENDVVLHPIEMHCTKLLLHTLAFFYRHWQALPSILCLMHSISANFIHRQRWGLKLCLFSLNNQVIAQCFTIPPPFQFDFIFSIFLLPKHSYM